MAKDIVVRVGANTASLVKGMDKASAAVGKLNKDMNLGKMAGKAAAVGIAAAGAAAATASAAIFKMTTSAANNAVEIARLSELSKTTASDFQKLAYAAETVGIEQEKLSDIYKDAQDKVGDFLENGGGPLADFFDNIAPKVGVTASEFENLSGPQVMEKYMAALESANLSQSRMTFYLEAIASDATALQPLLANNAEGFKALGEEAEQAGAVMSDMDVARLEAMDDSMRKVRETAGAAANTFGTQFAPLVGAVADRMLEVRGETNILQTAAKKSFEFIVKAVGFAVDAIRGMHIVIKGLEIGFKAMGVGALYVLESLLSGIDYMINSAKASINALIDGMNALPGVDIAKLTYGESQATQKITAWKNSLVEGTKEAREEIDELMAKPMPSEAWDKFVEDAKAASNEAAIQIMTDRQKALGIESDMEEGGESQVVKQEQEEYKERLTLAQQFSAAMDHLNNMDAESKLAATEGVFSALAGLMSSENKKLFNIGKVAAMSQATVDGISAAISSFRAGAKIGGPILGGIFAGASALATGAQISALASTSYGSSSSGSASAASATPSLVQPVRLVRLAPPVMSHKLSSNQQR